jgi:hypothetical protein
MMENKKMEKKKHWKFILHIFSSQSKKKVLFKDFLISVKRYASLNNIVKKKKKKLKQKFNRRNIIQKRVQNISFYYKNKIEKAFNYNVF